MTQTTTTDVLELDKAAQDLLFRSARTANAFTDEPVSDEHVAAIHDLVKWGPTAMNGQPLRVTLVRSKQARERLVTHMADGNKAKTRTAPLVAILTADHDFHEQLPTQFPPFPGARDLYAGMPGRAEAARLNATLQAGYFLVGVRAAGLAAGPMTGYDAEGLTREFFPEGNHSVLCVVNLGYPAQDAWFDRLPRLEYPDVVQTV
jgi:3-hydroxypropanoate dehydrogenase